MIPQWVYWAWLRIMLGCWTGPGPQPAELFALCHCFDVNHDSAIDLRDFAAMLIADSQRAGCEPPTPSRP